MTFDDMRRPTLRPPPNEGYVVAKPKLTSADRPSPRAFLWAGALDALEHLCTGAIPFSDPEHETIPAPPPSAVPSDAPTLKALPGDAE